jgi:hypothetical protein
VGALTESRNIKSERSTKSTSELQLRNSRIRAISLRRCCVALQLLFASCSCEAVWRARHLRQVSFVNINPLHHSVLIASFVRPEFGVNFVKEQTDLMVDAGLQ